MADNKIDQALCKQCGSCVALCPNRIIENREIEGGCAFNADRSPLCLKCGHCMAACSERAVQIQGLSYEDDFFDLPRAGPGERAFVDLISTRRSVRVFKDKPVPKEVLSRITDAIALAPMGFPPHKVEVTVVCDRQVLNRALPMMTDFYWKLVGWLEHRIPRFMMKRRLPAQIFNTLDKHLLPILKKRLPYMEKHGVDDIMRAAPAMLLFHADTASESYTDDAVIDLTYGLLAAHAMGLGATALSLVPPAVNKTPQLKQLFQIPPRSEVVAAMIVGYPKYRFKRGIKRQLASVSWLAGVNQGAAG